MKTLALTLAAAATLAAGAAHADNNSFANGDGYSFNPNPQVLFGGAGLDREPTASIGTVAGGQVFRSEEVINGRDVTVRYHIIDGERVILSTSQASDR